MDPIITTEVLKGYKKPLYDDDYCIETVDKKYALYFYNINEVRMMSYSANLAIFEKNKFETPLLSSEKIRIWYSKSKTYIYAQKSDCLIFRMGANSVNPIKPIRPYLLVKPKASQFSLIDWDVSSSCYSLKELNENILLVEEESPQCLDQLNFVRRTGEIIDLNELIWYDFTKFDNALEIYINR